MSYFYPAPPLNDGYTPVVAAPQSGLRFLALGRLHLEAVGGQYAASTGAEEMVIDVLGGRGMVALEGAWGAVRYADVGQRPDAFAGPPEMVYVPPRTRVTITALAAPLSAVIVRAPARRETSAARVHPADVPGQVYGRRNWQRTVYLAIGLNVDADRIVMGETHTPPGNWSSYPPHKHDRDNPPAEVASEEIYHFLIDPPHGFGLQYLWTAPGDPHPIHEAYPLHNGDTVTIPRGYHPVVVAPGFRMVTVWAFAGQERRWGAWAPLQAIANRLAEP